MGGKLDGVSHLARGHGVVPLSYVFSSTEQVLHKCLWVSKSWRGRRDQYVVRNGIGGARREDTREEKAEDRMGVFQEVRNLKWEGSQTGKGEAEGFQEFREWVDVAEKGRMVV